MTDFEYIVKIFHKITMKKLVLISTTGNGRTLLAIDLYGDLEHTNLKVFLFDDNENILNLSCVPVKLFNEGNYPGWSGWDKWEIINEARR
jgi:hypothetical protein